MYFVLKYTNLGVYAIIGFSSLTAIIKNITYLPIYAAKCLDMSKLVFFSEIIKNICIGIIVVIINLIVSKFVVVNGWVSLSVCAAVMITVGTMITFILGFNKEEKYKYINMLKRGSI